MQVLTGLGHHALVGGHDQQHQVDSPRPRNHVADELGVSRHVHDAKGDPARRRIARKADVDRDPALFLFLEAVAVDAGQRLDQARLAVVDVPGRPQDEVTFIHRPRPQAVMPPARPLPAAARAC